MTESNRDDFSPSVIAALAKRCGYLCSFPDCNAATIGPSNEGSEKISNVGVACHISAAAPGKGSRRYDPLISSVERSAIENGIWMCQTHSKLIDTDEELYSVQTLKSWKEIAEKKAQFFLGRQKYIFCVF